MKKIIMIFVSCLTLLLLLPLHFANASVGGYTVNVATGTWNAIVNKQVQITADLTNNQDRDQPFAYLVQIQNERGVTVALSWISGSLAPRQSMNPSQSWMPTATGNYTAQIFVWESVDNPDALSAPLTMKINVVETKNT